METNDKDANPVLEAVRFYFGERCPEHEDGCPACMGWRAYDDLMGIVNSHEAPVQG